MRRFGRGLGVVVWLAAAAALGASAVAPIGAANALTLPAQRHLVRIDTGNGRPPTVLLAVQQQWSGARGLQLYRSDDATGVGRTWTRVGAIQPDPAHTDRAELLAVGRDLAVVYSYEGPSLSGSTRHDVYFQWWRYRADTHTWAPQPAVRVFDSTSSSSAYARALIARDSKGRLWVQAFRLESGGGNTAVIAVSEDGGATFRSLTTLGYTRKRGGGRLLHVGDKLVFFWAMHDGFEPTRMRIHADADLPEKWSAQRDAFSDGIYHGAALSAVADGAGGIHLVYKDEAERLQYRHFDGASWSARQQVDSRKSWALQPAITRVGGQVFIFFNAPRSDGTYELALRVLDHGALGPLQRVNGAATFKGYPNALDVLPTTVSEVPILWGDAPDTSSAGTLMRAAAARTPDAGGGDTGGGDTGGGDAGGGGTPPPVAGTLLFSDDFETAYSSGLGPRWSVVGRWYTNGKAKTDLDGQDLALAAETTCANCEVEARLVGFGVDEVGLVLRASGSQHYAAVLRGDGRVEVRRYSGSGYVVLGRASSGIADLASWATVALSARGGSTVELVVTVNGVPRLAVTDSGSGAITGAGAPGMVTRFAGVWFDAFRVRAVE